MNQMLKDCPGIGRKVKDLVREYQDIFSSPEKAIGQTNLIEFDIKLKLDATPVRSNVRPLNHKQGVSLKERLDIWKKEDIIEEMESPWASVLVPALKRMNRSDGQ